MVVDLTATVKGEEVLAERSDLRFYEGASLGSPAREKPVLRRKRRSV